jgi:hypothetical protein
VPAVDKITGPGNAYVASAKRRVFGQVGIDMIAGPSEILVLADGSTPVDWVAMDLFSQAEHDELAQSILLCPDAAYLDAVQQAIDRLLPIQRADFKGIFKAMKGLPVTVRLMDPPLHEFLPTAAQLELEIAHLHHLRDSLKAVEELPETLKLLSPWRTSTSRRDTEIGLRCCIVWERRQVVLEPVPAQAARPDPCPASRLAGAAGLAEPGPERPALDQRSVGEPGQALREPVAHGAATPTGAAGGPCPAAPCALPADQQRCACPAG